METLIDGLLDCDKYELSEAIKVWETQKYKAKTNDEYDLICKRIKMGECILQFNKHN